MGAFFAASGRCADAPRRATTCAGTVDNYFEDEVWAKVGAQKCLTCHRKGGDAEDSTFILSDPRKSEGAARAEVMRQNREAFTTMAKRMRKDKSRILLKVVGDLDHGGKDVLKADSAGYRILADFVGRTNNPGKPSEAASDPKGPAFFDGVAMLDDRRLLRRVTLSLAGRLPTDAEVAAIAKDGRKAMPAILDALMKEDAFYERLREGFNDIFLLVGITGNPDQVVLSYEHFTKTRQWYSKHDLSQIKDEKERQRAANLLAIEYRKSLLGEPMKLVEYIVRQDRPFTEIVTADYIMVSPYSARGYGVFEEVKAKFKNPDDQHEYVPVRLKALVGRGSKDENQESATGFYPHAGLLSTFQYVTRYPTTETNRNRLRARMYYQHFLGVDVLELAARVSDAAAVTAKYPIPTMQASECVVCHKTLDPVASLFQDYWRFADTSAVFGRRKGGWFTDMFQAGFEGEDMPASERWRSLQWLGERTAKDPRFAIAMTEHVYYILTGRKVLLEPKDLEDPLYGAKLRAYREQRRQTEAIASSFSKSGFNLKNVFKDWVASDFYRADGVATAIKEPCRRTELDDIGLVRMLAPEQVERKINAVFGEKWGKLNGALAMLYGGIDSQEVTDRATDPSGAMGAIQRILSNDVACKHVARDFARPAKERKLFPDIEPDVMPGASAEADQRIRKTIVHLHERILGRQDVAESAEVDRTFQLFAAIVKDAKDQKGIDKLEKYSCRQGVPVPQQQDSHYTIRAWRGVVTYLLRRQEFLYE
jgi:hypothetical protein